MKFFRNLFILAAALCVVAAVLLQFSGNAVVHSFIWHMLGFFVFVTGFTHYLTDLGYKNDPDNFQAYYFASMGFRMVLSIGVVALFAYFYKEGRLQFVFNFFALYFLFTGFEIYSLLANLRPNLKRQN
ncbi:hypothetical protein CLV24_10358 [Pontibacter ummariensis]|uniref:Uncharacterized protein n=1 Tax=Pontibacter ummariensis TaxID=1610492 RepID=A0A239CV12_9BACT|nr:hypothetical protein [Pontibacter ummariensis]PRY14821.1 hypothetical protein CLV24_10358 [Pontibacter ummariensis]SNS23779.1 hypothetical protein SAMN06296052_103255 [Pontibacter ummariensis]